MQTVRTHSLFYCIIIMMASLFFSRALLSVSMVVFVLVSFFHGNIKAHFRSFFSSPLCWGMSLLFLLPLVSGLWSENSMLCMEMLQVKLPLLFLPLAFAGPVLFSKKQWDWLATIFVVSVTAGTGWSLFHYAGNAASINDSYLMAKSMMTPLQNDHVRFSWMVSVAIILSGWMIYQNRDKTIAWLWLLLISWLVVFLHLLAARTGLASFYICLLLLATWLLLKKMRWQYSVCLLLLMLSLPVMAYYTIPTFQNRVKYFNYEMAWFKKAGYLPGANDAVRVISMKAGWNVMKENPATGVGFGDVREVTKKWYASAYPEMKEEDKIYPASEWLMYGAGCGIPGFILFTIALCIPFFTKVKHRLVWYMLNATAAFSLIADIGLEVQFGVFLYAFTVLWYWKWLNAGNK